MLAYILLTFTTCSNYKRLLFSILCTPSRSWSPLTALSSLLRDAKFLRNGKEVYVPPGRVLDPSNIRQLNFLPGFNLEGLYNRDSTKYVFAYGIPTAHTVVRGTIRYKVRLSEGYYYY